MERIGGDRICESASTAASTMAVLASPIPSRELDMLAGFGKGKARRRLPRMTSPSFLFERRTHCCVVRRAPGRRAIMFADSARRPNLLYKAMSRELPGDADEHAGPAVTRGPGH